MARECQKKTGETHSVAHSEAISVTNAIHSSPHARRIIAGFGAAHYFVPGKFSGEPIDGVIDAVQAWEYHDDGRIDFKTWDLDPTTPSTSDYRIPFIYCES